MLGRGDAAAVPCEGAMPVVVIGASWGGLHALSTIVGGLPASIAAPVVVVQHRSRTVEGFLTELLQDVTPLRVHEAEDKEPLQSGHVYVAPPDYHLLVDGPLVSLSVDALVRWSRPSIDVTLASAADACGPRAVGIVLTGANDDGARGLRHVIDRGGYGIVQDPGTAEVRTMPEAAIQALAGAPTRSWEVAPLDRIAERVVATVDRLRPVAARPTGAPR
jgi:two-component system, chemotaxis family, protein-glutamate methylesterase/glutaminase